MVVVQKSAACPEFLEAVQHICAIVFGLFTSYTLRPPTETEF